MGAGGEWLARCQVFCHIVLSPPQFLSQAITTFLNCSCCAPGECKSFTSIMFLNHAFFEKLEIHWKAFQACCSTQYLSLSLSTGHDLHFFSKNTSVLNLHLLVGAWTHLFHLQLIYQKSLKAALASSRVASSPSSHWWPSTYLKLTVWSYIIIWIKFINSFDKIGL